MKLRKWNENGFILFYLSAAACNISSVIMRAPESRAPKPILNHKTNSLNSSLDVPWYTNIMSQYCWKAGTHPGNRYILFAWFTWPTFPFPAVNLTKYVCKLQAYKQFRRKGNLMQDIGISNWFKITDQYVPRTTFWKGLPLANTICSPACLKASAGVHSAAQWKSWFRILHTKKSELK